MNIATSKSASRTPAQTSVPMPDGRTVSALLDTPAKPVACCVLAHGAGAGMNHAFLAEVASGLADRSVATLRFQFPYMEAGSRRPDSPAVAQAAVRAAVEVASQCLPNLPMFAAGKSFGGRMSSQAQATQPLPNVRGLIFLGFPLHPAGKPSITRADHLHRVQVPMLFLQGTRDALADMELMRDMTATLANDVSLHVVDGADHSFHVLKRSGRDDGQVLVEMLDTMVAWMKAHVS